MLEEPTERSHLDEVASQTDNNRRNATARWADKLQERSRCGIVMGVVHVCMYMKVLRVYVYTNYNVTRIMVNKVKETV